MPTTHTAPRSMHRTSFFLATVMGSICISAVIVALASLRNVGVGWDSPLDTLIAIQVRSIPPGLNLDGAYNLIYHTGEFYGVLVPTLADTLHFITTGDRITLMPDVVETFAWQGLVGVLLAIVGAVALGAAVYLVTRSLLSALFALTLLLSTPLFLGHSFVNTKDLPFAVGLTLVTLSLVMAYCKPTVRWSLLSGLIGAIGLIIALGTRIGGWPLAITMTVTAAALSTLSLSPHKRKAYSFRVLLSVSLAWTAGLTGICVLNPLARLGLFSWMWDSLEITRAYPYRIPILTAGQLVDSTNSPWWYAPAWLLVQLPIPTIVLAIAAVFISFNRARCTSPRSRLSFLGKAAPFFVQGLLLPIVVLVSAGTLYDGIRHLLFALPGFIGLVVVTAVPTILNWMSRSTGVRSLGVGLVLVLVPTVSLVDSARWSPFTYAYLNPIAHLWGEEAWEVDYWGTSALAAAKQLRTQEFDTIVVIPTNSTSLMEGAQSIEELDHGVSGDVGVYQFRRAGIPFPDSACTELFRIARDGFLIGIAGKCSDTKKLSSFAASVSLHDGSTS